VEDYVQWNRSPPKRVIHLQFSEAPADMRHFCCSFKATEAAESSCIGKDSNRMCPYVVTWLGPTDVEGCSAPGEFSFAEGESVIVLPSFRLPGYALLAGVRSTAVEPAMVDLTRVAMLTRSRPHAPCIACEDGPGCPPGTKFERLIVMLCRMMRARSELGTPCLLGSTESSDVTGEDIEDACRWLRKRAVEYGEDKATSRKTTEVKGPPTSMR